MDDAFKQAIKKLLASQSQAAEGLQAAAEEMARVFDKQKTEIEDRRRRVKEELDRGARLTKHRISL